MLQHAPALAVVLLLGCQPVLNESTPAVIFDAPFEDVFVATRDAFGRLGLQIYEVEPDKGYIYGGRNQMCAAGCGMENVGVRLERVEQEKTTVRIDTRYVLGYLYNINWTPRLFEQIPKELRKVMMRKELERKRKGGA